MELLVAWVTEAHERERKATDTLLELRARMAHAMDELDTIASVLFAVDQTLRWCRIPKNRGVSERWLRLLDEVEREDAAKPATLLAGTR